MRHLESLVGDGSHAAEVRLIALVLQDGLLSQLYPMLFFQLLDQRFKELLLGLHLLHFGRHLERYSLLHAPLVHLIPANLCK